MEDIRWKQRFSNLSKAFSKLDKAVQLSDPEDYQDQWEWLNSQYQETGDEQYANQLENLELQREGLIQRFEYCYELFINTLRDLMLFQGAVKEELNGNRAVLAEALEKGYISEHDLWREMLLARNDTSHSYNHEIAVEVTRKIHKVFYPLMKKLFATLKTEDDQN